LYVIVQEEAQSVNPVCVPLFVIITRHLRPDATETRILLIFGQNLDVVP